MDIVYKPIGNITCTLVLRHKYPGVLQTKLASTI